jgi:hypothetical protein
MFALYSCMQTHTLLSELLIVDCGSVFVRIADNHCCVFAVGSVSDHLVLSIITAVAGTEQ